MRTIYFEQLEKITIIKQRESSEKRKKFRYNHPYSMNVLCIYEVQVYELGVRIHY